jgi:hypothetical protein
MKCLSFSSTIHRFVVGLFFGLALCFALSAPVLAFPHEAASDSKHFIVFDAPGAGTGFFQGTYATYINNSGELLGYLQDSNNVFHAFLRRADGTFLTFDAQGAGAGAFQGTFAPGILPEGFNDRGDVAGQYVDANNITHSFIRAKDGAITTFDAPESVAGSFADGISNCGAVVGAANGANFVYHAFVRNEIGVFTVFDAPDAGVGGTALRYQGTFATGVNAENEIVGVYIDSANLQHGFLRDKDGVLTEFQVPSADGSILAYPFSVNNNREISGFYMDSNSAFHGFLRKRDGTLITFDVPGAGTAAFEGTSPYVINAGGEIAGFWVDANSVDHGFVRKKDGTIVTFDVPAAGSAPGQGTFPVGINDAGDIVGDFVDTNNVTHGFLLLHQK